MVVFLIPAFSVGFLLGASWQKRRIRRKFENSEWDWLK